MNTELKQKLDTVMMVMNTLNVSVMDVLAYLDVIDAVNAARESDDQVLTTDALRSWYEDDQELRINAERRIKRGEELLGRLFLRDVVVSDKRVTRLLSTS